MKTFDYMLRCIFIVAMAFLIGSCCLLKTHAAEKPIAIIYTDHEEPIEDEHCDFVTYEKENPYASIRMTEQEARELELILAMEAQTESLEGQMAVVEVIFSRVISEDPYFPDTVHGVLSQRGQFATWKYINHPYNTPNETQSDAIAEVLASGCTILPDTSYVFFSRGKQGYAKDHIKIGRHWFGRSKR